MRSARPRDLCARRNCSRGCVLLSAGRRVSVPPSWRAATEEDACAAHRACARSAQCVSEGFLRRGVRAERAPPARSRRGVRALGFVQGTRAVRARKTATATSGANEVSGDVAVTAFRAGTKEATRVRVRVRARVRERGRRMTKVKAQIANEIQRSKSQLPTGGHAAFEDLDLGLHWVLGLGHLSFAD